MLALVLVAGACTRPDAAPAPADTAASPVAAPGDGARAAAPVVEAAPACLVTATAVGRVALGATLAEARAAWPAARFARASVGEGVALVEIAEPGGASMAVHAGEDDRDAPIDWTRRISHIETSDPRCATAAGVRPGALVVEVERILGATTRIVQSEIESREYIEFERQPAGLTFRLDYTGIFPARARETTRFDPAARLLSIAIGA